MPYDPDYPTPAAEPRRPNLDTFLPETSAKTPTEYATSAVNPLIYSEEQETHPPTPSLDPGLAARHGLILPAGTHLIDAADWELLVDTKIDRRVLELCSSFGRDKVAGWIETIEGEIEEPGTIAALEAKRRAASKRRVGALSTPSLIRKEMAALYRETYLAEPDDARHYTRMMYMLDCLARTAALERKLMKPAEKAGQSAEE